MNINLYNDSGCFKLFSADSASNTIIRFVPICLSMYGSCVLFVFWLRFEKIRSFTLNNLIAWVALCDFIWNMATATNYMLIWFGYYDYFVLSSMFVIQIFFATSSILWMTSVSLYMYIRLIYGKNFLAKYKFWAILHAVIWSFTTLLSTPEALSLKFLSYADILTSFWIFPIIAIYLSALVLYGVLIFLKLEELKVKI